MLSQNILLPDPGQQQERATLGKVMVQVEEQAIMVKAQEEALMAEVGH